MNIETHKNADAVLDAPIPQCGSIPSARGVGAPGKPMAGKTSFLDFRDFQTCSGASLLVVHSLSQQAYTRYTYGTYVRYTSPTCPVFACPFRPNESCTR